GNKGNNAAASAVPATPPVARATPAATGVASPAAVQPKRGGTLRTALTSYTSSFDPQAVGASAIRTIFASRLFTAKTGPGVPDLSNQFVPDVVESSEIPDPLTMVLKLRGNVRFGPPVGRPMTADDAVYSFARYVGESPGAPPNPNGGIIKQIFNSPTATDLRTLRLTLKVQRAIPAAPPSGAFTPYIMPVEAEKGYDPNKVAVGTGPWLFDRATTNSQIVWKRNPDWHLGPERPYLDSWEQYVIGDYATRLTQFLGGNIDTAESI